MKQSKRATSASDAGVAKPTLGLVEWFRPGEYDHVEAVLVDLRALGITELHTGFSWADWHTEAGKAWYDWLLPRLAQEVNVLPCFTYTPPSLGMVPKSSSPPRHPKDYADFLDVIVTRLGRYFEWVELWNEPNNLNDWDWRLDPSWQIFCTMVGGAAYWMHQRGKKTVLGGMCPTDPNWLDLLCRRGVMQHIDAVGVHGFPGTWEFDWQSWPEVITKVQEVLAQHPVKADIWITEAGYSTWRHDEYRQLGEFMKFAASPVTRAYWYSAYDLHPDLPHQDGFHEDERHYHFGLKYADGQPKLLFRVWATQGLSGVRALAQLGEPQRVDVQPMTNGTSKTHNGAHRTPAYRVISASPRLVLITGGAGFIGTNLAHRLLSSGNAVWILDNLSRPGVERNLHWLRSQHGHRLHVQVADIRNPHVMREGVQRAKHIFHFAAQVAVTTSLERPVTDFEINMLGTLNLLEALRGLKNPPPVVFTSTNKVYGELNDIVLRQNVSRYEPEDGAIRLHGVSEERSLDFHSPYGCSKGAADQYVIDYARIYGLPTVVFRMSCIYGPHQCGTEDQGWVAHFLICTLSGQPITLYGDGRQVRDILFVHDLVNALLDTQTHMNILAGQAFNIGGGPGNVTSLIELIERIGALHGTSPEVQFAPWRPGDQRYYVSDTRRFTQATGWTPRVSVDEGVAALYDWLRQEYKISAARAIKPASVLSGVLQQR